MVVTVLARCACRRWTVGRRAGAARPSSSPTWRGRLAAGILALASVSTPAAAQIATDGSLGPARVLSGPAYAIEADLGQVRGPNLFHSFGQFNVRAGESATFSGPASVQNILGRVTGEAASLIDGLLRSAIPGANLYLLNPRGISFGPNASLDVGGAFRASTADVLRLADGATFPTSLLTPTALSVAPPAAFGFLGAAPGAISVQGSVLEVPRGQSLAVVGGDVRVRDAVLQAPSGRLEVVAVAGPGEVGVSGGGAGPGLGTAAFARLGQVDVSGSSLTVRGDPGGTVLIRGGQLVVDRSFLSASTAGAADHPGVGIDIDVRGRMSVTGGSEVAASSFGPGRAGSTRIVAGELEVAGDPATNRFTAIASRAFASGRAGDIDIVAGALRVQNSAGINTPSLAAGRGGDLTVTAGTVELLGEGGSAFLSTGAFGTGDAGHLTIQADRLAARGGRPGFTGLATQVADAAGGAAGGGRLTLHVGSLDLFAGAQVSSGTFSGSGGGGDMVITARTITIAGRDPSGFRAGIFSTAEGVRATGRGGSIRITAGEIDISEGGAISTSLLAGSPADAGSVWIQADRLDIRSRGFVGAAAILGTGDAGTLDIVADRLVITGVRAAEDPGFADFTGLATSTADGRGGDLRVTAGSVVVSDRGAIASNSTGEGPGGHVRLELGSGTLALLDGGTILSTAFGTGPGGAVEVTAGEVLLAGAAPFLGLMNPGVSAIASQAGLRGGAAGVVRVAATNVRVLDGSRIATDTFGPGAGGDVAIVADRLLVAGVSQPLLEALRAMPDGDPAAATSAIIASSNRTFRGDEATGRAGSVRVLGGDLRLDDRGQISTRTDTPGAGGRIDILGQDIVLTRGARVSAASAVSPLAGPAGDVSIKGTGTVAVDGSSIVTTADHAQGGSITLGGQQVQLTGDALVSATSGGAGDAGSVRVLAGEAFTIRHSALATEAREADGGNISIEALGLFHAVGADVSATVRGGQGRGGNVTIDPRFVVLDGSRISADAFGGPGGNVLIVAEHFLATDSVLSASSALGVPGSVDVQARVTDVSGSVAQLPQVPLRGVELLRASCAVRVAEGRTSSLVIAGREGLPPEPGGLLHGFAGDAGEEAGLARREHEEDSGAAESAPAAIAGRTLDTPAGVAWPGWAFPAVSAAACVVR